MPAPEPTAQRPGGARSRTVPVVAAAVVAVVVLFVIAAVVGGGDDEKQPAAVPAGVEQTRPVRVVGRPLDEFSDGRDRTVGAVAPGLEGRSFDGTPVSITNDGKPKVVVFVAHWCPHCQREVPVLAKWLQENGPPAGVSLYGVATGTTADRGNYPPSAWLRRANLTIPVMADDEEGTAAQAFGLSAYPFFVAIDGSGKVVARATGELSVDAFEALIEKARQGAGAA